MKDAIKINPGKGVIAFTFENGATLSMASAKGNYCTPDESFELHAWGPNKERINLKGRSETMGWVRPDGLPKYINKVRRWKPKEVAA